jgi:hypothetical protein
MAVSSLHLQCPKPQLELPDTNSKTITVSPKYRLNFGKATAKLQPLQLHRQLKLFPYLVKTIVFLNAPSRLLLATFQSGF